MATMLAPVDSREVLRCDHCHLVQFRTQNNLCRRCHLSLDNEEPEPVAAEPVVQPDAEAVRPRLQIASSIRNLRLSAGLSQRQLAMRMQVPRTYVSKIENEKATPTLSSLERLAKALEVPVPELLRTSCPTRERDIREFMADEFLAELIPYVSQLDAIQRSTVLAQMRDLTLHPRRSA